ncbi:MAG: 50S ribosomal protein L32e [Candidatus Altiarchaeota archaeon]|nr:50S ribosomal protein L32e [Candidatus Altiarchaeota archaeon]
MVKKSSEGSKTKEKAEKKPKKAAKVKVEDKKKKLEKKPVKKKAATPKKKAERKPRKKAVKEEGITEKKPEERKAKEGKGKPIEKIKFRVKKDITEIKKLRKKKPKFVRQELGKLKRLKDKWRTPRGIDSKKAEGKRGKGKLPKTGYRNPASVRGIHPYGFYPILIHNTYELENIDTKKEAAIIAACIGRKKRNELIKLANDRKITILNPRRGEL